MMCFYYRILFYGNFVYDVLMNYSEFRDDFRTDNTTCFLDNDKQFWVLKFPQLYIHLNSSSSSSSIKIW